MPDLERKIDQLEEDLNYLSARKDLRRLEDFITELSGAVLHPQVSSGPIPARQRVTCSASKSSIRRFVITEKAPIRAFSWLKAATTAFTFKTEKL